MKVKDIRGGWAVVTGASSGIGLEFSRQLAAMGCNLLMVSNQPEELERHSAAISAEFGVEARILDTDLSARDGAERVMQAVTALPDIPLILINNAGIFDFRAVENLRPARLDLYIDLHIRTVTHLCQRMAALMATRHRGCILNMSSMSCWMPMPGIAMYSATKAYIRVFSRALAIELGGTGVSVTVACPGGIATDLFGLPRRLQRVGVAVGALATPRGFVRRALRRMLRGRQQYVNGLINRLAIVAVAMLPRRARRLVKTQLLDRLDKRK